MTAKEHYDLLLADVYAWMLGDFRERMLEQKRFFETNGIQPRANGVAWDLGAGTGIQSVALAELGFKVKAVDFNAKLLEDLASNKGSLPVERFQEDIADFVSHGKENPDLIVCMGDTLTHFDDHSKLRSFIACAASSLSENGKIVLSWRDSSIEIFGVDRFIHVKSDETRTLTCFLEYFPQHLVVHDIVTEKVDGILTQKISSYPKLRLSTAVLRNLLEQNQIAILGEQTIRGMTFLTGEKINRT